MSTHYIPPPKSKLVYIVKAGDAYKIGRATDLKNRLYWLAVGNPNEIECVRVINSDHPDQLERFLHDKFKHRRIRREWFNLTEEDLREISTIKDINIEETLIRVSDFERQKCDVALIEYPGKNYRERERNKRFALRWLDRIARMEPERRNLILSLIKEEYFGDVP